jgi:hypothetical protein
MPRWFAICSVAFNPATKRTRNRRFEPILVFRKQLLVGSGYQREVWSARKERGKIGFGEEFHRGIR